MGSPNSRKKLNRKIELFSFLTATNLFQVNVSAEASDRTRRPRSSPDRGAKFKEAASLDAAFCVFVDLKSLKLRITLLVISAFLVLHFATILGIERVYTCYNQVNQTIRRRFFHQLPKSLTILGCY